MEPSTGAIEVDYGRRGRPESVEPAKASVPLDSRCAADDLGIRIRLFLDRSHVAALRGVDVQVSGDQVTLSGKVNSYYEKQLATEFTRRVAGVIGIDNRVEVVPWQGLLWEQASGRPLTRSCREISTDQDANALSFKSEHRTLVLGSCMVRAMFDVMVTSTGTIKLPSPVRHPCRSSPSMGTRR